jgi:basic amino acid/polyamine antiporter, APA family
VAKARFRAVPGPEQSANTGIDRLALRLGTGDAVVIGLGAMIGAGVFAVFGPAARAAGSASATGGASSPDGGS